MPSGRAVRLPARAEVAFGDGCTAGRHRRKSKEADPRARFRSETIAAEPTAQCTSSTGTRLPFMTVVVGPPNSSWLNLLCS